MRRLPATLVVALVAVLGTVSPTAPAAAAAPAPPARTADGWLVDRVRFEPLNKETSLGLINGTDYRGAIEVAPTTTAAATGTRPRPALTAINEVSLDDYLLGVSEVPTSWPVEAQKAQAIAARTYVLHEIGRAAVATTTTPTTRTSWRAAGADICATQACQVYAGLDKLRRPGAETWRHAVQTTDDQVLVYQGMPILAKYSSSNGGRSVQGGHPYLRSIDDPDDTQSPLHRWKSSATLAEVAAAFGIGGQLKWTRSAGDVVELIEEYPDGATVRHNVAAPDFRARLNGALPALDGLPLRLPSARFAAWTDEPSGTVFLEGRGWGHGVGMSQYGALGKAMRGMRADDILASYYAGLKPVKVPTDQLPEHVKVAVAVDAPEVTVVAGGQFRVTDGSGIPLAHVADGAWTLRAEPRGVRVVPPAHQAAPPAVEALGVSVESAGTNKPAVVKLRLSTPALVDITVTRPGGAPLRLDPRPASAGELAVRLAAAEAGEYVVDVVARAGAGRESSTPVRFRVSGLDPGAIPELLAFAAPASPPDPGLPATVALLLLAGLVLRMGRSLAARIH